MKECYSCKQTFSLDNFYKDKTKKDGRTPYCKACRKIKAANQYQKDPTKAITRAMSLREREGPRADLKRMGLTWEQYSAMLKEQNERCAICNKYESITQAGITRRLSIDHDHSCCYKSRDVCGKCNRGLLCQKCNMMLGSAGDSIEVLMSAIKYLEKNDRVK